MWNVFLERSFAPRHTLPCLNTALLAAVRDTRHAHRKHTCAQAGNSQITKATPAHRARWKKLIEEKQAG